MKKILLIFCLITFHLTAQNKSKKVEIYKSITSEFLDAKISIENDIEKDIQILFYGRDHQYTHIDSYITFFTGAPKDFFVFINKLKEAFNEDENVTLTIDDKLVTIQKLMGKKVISLSVKDKSGYRLFNQKSIDKIIDKFIAWADEKKVVIK